ncbi:uncharacterized protein TRIADDRAFT_51906 [Trichoplax adhaerens]|uniref:SRCR domain-containing protein n=1 Tax=Trichoplax adhaerens TaxID=10228 RepID=B3RL77_TRIAD|nr:hypothetical protein TRIADDRAFT_51906 [Trichoplax adhaerens]EDV28715.1 hypothetical protein TRIADDRAFT_51906 [Trichoplax adhaerens]|eukprot:XP_002107917.1 hypothetical protein TRIADDRAFT_51906 [Trichoplax adhaerens]
MKIFILLGGNVEGQGPIWLQGHDIKCPPTAIDLAQCTLGPWDVNNTCTHAYDLYVSCNPSPIVTYQTTASTTLIETVAPPLPRNKYKLAIKDGFDITSGFVNVLYNKRNGVICSKNWNMNDADVVCRQLGFLNALSANASITQYAIRHEWITELNCKGYESTIDACPIQDSSVIRNCSTTDIATISCNQEKQQFTSRNRPTYCIYDDGFCGWKISGNMSWIWHSATGNHYHPIAGAISYAYVIRPYHQTSMGKAVMTSPVLTARSGQVVEISFRYYIVNLAVSNLEIRYNEDGNTGITIFDNQINTSNKWTQMKTTGFTPKGNHFRLKIIYSASRTFGPSFVSILAIDDTVITGVENDGYQSNDISIIGAAVAGGLACIIFLMVAICYYKKSKTKIIRDVSVPNEYVASTSRQIRNFQRANSELLINNQLPRTPVNSNISDSNTAISPVVVRTPSVTLSVTSPMSDHQSRSEDRFSDVTVTSSIEDGQQSRIGIALSPKRRDIICKLNIGHPPWYKALGTFILHNATIFRN